MIWLLKQLQPPDRHNTRNSTISTYLRDAICAAVALCGPPICDPTEKTSSSDIVPSFVSCWSATRFAIFAEVGCGRKVKTPFERMFQASNIKCEQLWNFRRFLERDGKAKKSRGVAERESEREAAFGRGARSSRLLRCSSSNHHDPKFCYVIRAFVLKVLREDVVLQDLLSSIAHNKNSGISRDSTPLYLIRHLPQEATHITRRS